MNKILLILSVFLSLNTFARDRDFTHQDHLKEWNKRQPGVNPASDKSKKVYKFNSPEIEITVIDKKDKKKEK